MSKLAILGHPTRGSEVIELLEMFGGINSHNLYGDESYAYYTIDSDKEIKGGIYVFGDEDLSSFTLEQFLAQFPYKVGNKVYYDNKVCNVVEMLWNSNLNTISYGIHNGKIKNLAIVEELQPNKEEPMEENIKEKCDLINFNSHYIFDFADKVELILKDDWEVKNEDGRTYVVRKQQTYPKTYNECWKILDAGEEEVLLDGATASEEVLFDSFIKLKRCRDAYWKIAGDWEPNLNSKQHKFAISNVGNKISFEVYGEYNSILCFPTEEIRDAFYENFKDLIEQCKELL